MRECSCWSEYPNECHKKNNGKWKCVDYYTCIKDRKDDRKHKTKCYIVENSAK